MIDSMAKKKKRPAGKPVPPKAPKEPPPFHAPFAGLKQALKLGEPPAPPPAPAAPAAPGPEPGEEVLFARAMTGVAPLGGGAGQRREPALEPASPYLDRPLDEDLEVMAQLADLVSGQAEFDLRYSDEYVQGCLPGVGEELKERLARGDFPIQDYLDLHGHDREGALAALEGFLRAALGRGLRHVLIVHGKGQGSPEGEPVLKRAVAAWLMRKRLRRWVLAFCTARACDGGEGAMYLLLRKWREGGSRLSW
jgi:DNA-nicking Smr family endonuclease